MAQTSLARYRHEMASRVHLAALSDEIEERMRHAYIDFYGGMRFPVRHSAGPKLGNRPKNGSAYATFVVTKTGDWQCCEFRKV